MAKLSELSKYIKDAKEEVKDEVKEIVFFYASDLLLKAQRSLNAYTGTQLDNLNFINLSIFSDIDAKGFSASVGVTSVDASKKSRLAAYVEFGTGLSAKEILKDYPEEVKELAKTFFETGEGTLKGSPYLFNNFFIVRENYQKELTEYLNEQFGSVIIKK